MNILLFVLSVSHDGLIKFNVTVFFIGEEAPDITPYVIGGYRAKINEAPWHAAIYKYSGTSYAFTCGATIINARVLLSAMHCKLNVA